MRTFPFTVACLVAAGVGLSGCASTSVVVVEAQAGPNSPHHPTAAVAQLTAASPIARAAPAPDMVRDVDIQPVANEPGPVCRRAMPTGSRISRQRCEMPVSESEEQIYQAMLQRDIQESRELSIMLEQQRMAQEQMESERRRMQEEQLMQQSPGR